MPWDCDMFMHMTNSRYIALQDISRSYATVEMGLVPHLRKAGIYPVLNAQEISYLKPLKPFQAFELSAEFVYFDERNYYIEHRFTSRGVLHAKSMVKGVFLNKSGVVPMEKVMSLANIKLHPMRPSDKIAAWIKLIEEKKSAIDLERKQG